MKKTMIVELTIEHKNYKLKKSTLEYLASEFFGEIEKKSTTKTIITFNDLAYLDANDATAIISSQLLQSFFLEALSAFKKDEKTVK